MDIALLEPTKIGEGHYCDKNGNEFMSIWIYNKKFNTNLNTKETALILVKAGKVHTKVPANYSNRFSVVNAFLLEDLHAYVRNNSKWDKNILQRSQQSKFSTY